MKALMSLGALVGVSWDSPARRDGLQCYAIEHCAFS